MPTDGPWTPILVPVLALGLAAVAGGESLSDLVSKPVDRTRASALQGKAFSDKSSALSLDKSALSSRTATTPPAFTTKSAAIGGKADFAERSAPMSGATASLGTSESPFSGRQALGFTGRDSGFQKSFPTQAAPGFDSAGTAHGFGGQVPIKPYLGPTPKAVQNAFAEQMERNLSIGELKEILNRETGDGPSTAEKAAPGKAAKASSPTVPSSYPPKKSAREASRPQSDPDGPEISKSKAATVAESTQAP